MSGVVKNDGRLVKMGQFVVRIVSETERTTLVTVTALHADDMEVRTVDSTKPSEQSFRFTAKGGDLF